MKYDQWKYRRLYEPFTPVKSTLMGKYEILHVLGSKSIHSVDAYTTTCNKLEY